MPDSDAGTRCRRPDCGLGTIDDQGFCTECGQRPVERAPDLPTQGGGGTVRATGPDGGAQGAGAGLDAGLGVDMGVGAGAGVVVGAGVGVDVGVGVANVRPDPWYGLGLADAAALPDTVDATVPPAGPVAEEHRFCDNPTCGGPVGRGHDGVPGRTAGFCPDCGTPFDFAEMIGQVIAGRYEVQRYLGSGAYGAAYLAHDRNLATDVVLKRLNNTAVARTAQDERNALVGLRHDAIVRILGYETQGPHLVLEHIPGAPLAARPGDRLEHLLAHGVRILQALDYLHARGLLHCDVKPVNIIRFREESPTGVRDRVRLIDFGSVRSLAQDTGPVTAYTPLYAPPEDDVQHTRPTPVFDLFCLGVTLKEVCRAQLRERTAPGIDSLHLLIDRATDAALPSRRFVSARQFGEQLSGVIRQVVAAPPTQHQVARASAVFGSMTEPLHGGLGAPRPLADWLEATSDRERVLVLRPAFASPAPESIAVALPTPLGDPDDPDIGHDAERALAGSRLALRRQDPVRAEHALAGAGLPRWHWLHFWYSGLIALARQDVDAATRCLTQVRRALPGELIPQLALGLCAELDGDVKAAQARYGVVFGTTPALGAAGFGLARVHLLDGRRADALAVTERLAQEFRYEREARVAAVRLLVTVAGEGPAPTPDDLAQARAALTALPVDDAARAGLRAELDYVEYLHTRERLTLSEAVRRLGPHVPTEREHTALIDLANRLRPPLERRWGGRRNRTGQSDTGGTSGALVS